MLMCIGGWADDVTSAIMAPSINETTPEYQYKVQTRSGNYWWSSTTTTCNNIENAGKFAFYAADGNGNYYIYSVDDQKWLSYDKQDSYSETQNFVTLVEEKSSANYFKVVKGVSTADKASNDKTGYTISPYLNDGNVAAQYLNWLYGASSQSGTDKVGIYTSQWGDAGSVWVLTPADDATKAKSVELWSASLPNMPGHVGSYTADQIADAATISFDQILTWKAANSPVAFDVNKYYRIYNYSRNSANYAWTVTETEGKTYPVNEKNLNQVIKFEASENGTYPYYIKSYSNGKYFATVVGGGGNVGLVAADADNKGAYKIEAKSDNATLFKFNCGGATGNNLYTDDDNRLDGWANGSEEYFYMQEVDINGFPVKNSDVTANYYQIKCNGNENYLNPFTFPTSEETERGVFQFYVNTDGVNGDKLYIYEAGSQKWLKYSDTNDGTKKISLADDKSDASLFVVNFNGSSTDIFNISPASKTTTSFNWYGGLNQYPYRKGTDSAMNGIGFHDNLNDGNSKWKIFAVTENIDDAVGNSAQTYATIPYSEILTEAKKYVDHIGDGLNQYKTTVDKATFSAAITALETALDEDDDFVTTGATLQGYIDNLQINQPTNGSFIRVRNAGGSNKRMSCVNQNNGRPAFANDLNIDKIFYYDGTYLRAYKTGMYVGIASNFLTNCTDPDANNGTTFTFSASPVNIGTYNVIFNGNRYLHDDGNAGSDAANSTDTKYTFWLEEVPNMYAVTINDADAYVQTADEVQVKTGGYLYVANGTAEVTASEKAGYTVDVDKNDEAKTVTVTYTEATPVKLTSGYYYIKNAASDKYLVNNYDFSTTTTLSGSNVRTNNGVWKVDVNDNKTITLKNGIATPLYVGEEAIKNLTFEGTPLTSGVYFTEKIDGSGDALVIGSEKAAATTWVFEPITSTDKIVDVIINGDNGEGVVIYNNNQKAIHGGFFDFNVAEVISRDKVSLSPVGEMKSGIVKFAVTNNPRSIVAEYYVFDAPTIAKLQALIDEIAPKFEERAIGYPRFENQEANVNYATIAWYAGNNLLSERDESEFLNVLVAAHDLANCADINLPTPGGFYTLSNGSETKTYFFQEGNAGLSQLLCYGGTENGQFAEISEDFTSVAYKAIGNDSGEDFAFMAARTNDKGMPVNFGKVCVWQSGEGPLPSGDNNFYSGWTITKANPIVKTHPDTKFGTFYCPVPVKLLSGKAYTATTTKTETGIKINLTEIDGNIIPKNTAVIVEGDVQVTTELGADDVVPTGLTSALCGTAFTIVKSVDNIQKYDNECNAALTMTANDDKPIFKNYVGDNFNGFKAFLPYNKDAQSNEFVLVFGEDDLTGMKTINVEKTDTPIYDLQGNKVVNLIKGQIYIKNGKPIRY